MPSKQPAKPLLPALDDPALYLNRELSHLAFNQRVLAQASDTSHPLLERLRYLCITSSNMDEFFEIRVAGLKQQQELKVNLMMMRKGKKLQKGVQRD